MTVQINNTIDRAAARIKPLAKNKLATVRVSDTYYIFNATAYGDFAIEVPARLMTKELLSIQDLDLTKPEDAKELKKAFGRVISGFFTKKYAKGLEPINVNIGLNKKSKLSNLFTIEADLSPDDKRFHQQLGRIKVDIYLRDDGLDSVQGAGYFNLKLIDTVSKYLPDGNYRTDISTVDALEALIMNTDDIRAVIMPIKYKPDSTVAINKERV